MRTRNFTLEEVIHSPLSELPEDRLPIAYVAMGYMQQARDGFGDGIIITSGYRDASRNATAGSSGGVDNSYHMWRYDDRGYMIWAIDCKPVTRHLEALYQYFVDTVNGEVYMNTDQGIVHVAPYGNRENWIS